MAAETAVPAPLRIAAEQIFGGQTTLAEAYAALLVSDGVERGLIGPAEAPRIWERHLLNCAVIAELVPPGASLLDIGSGAGLPGLVLAIARPDLSVVLLEPLARRVAFLREAVAALGLTTVAIVRARAEECRSDRSLVEPAEIVTARAVARLDRLAGWGLPLVVPGGRLLALKGETAATEVARYRAHVLRLGGREPTLRRCGAAVIEPPTTVVEIVRDRVIREGNAGPVSRRRSASHDERGH